MLNKNLKLVLFILLQAVLITGCASHTTVQAQKKEASDLFQPITIRQPLISVNVIDRNGLSETIGSKDRLKQYENINFLTSQSYQKVLR
ncbi:MAG: hypothetical protein JWO53_32, partial [Chlamydiia bacterium]|nr:hypothetical protein [Chlamydiia bacterium]